MVLSYPHNDYGRLWAIFLTTGSNETACVPSIQIFEQAPQGWWIPSALTDET
jgi:hypothetical protein